MVDDGMPDVQSSVSEPLTVDERAELEALRAEKAARERNELARLRAEKKSVAAGGAAVTAGESAAHGSRARTASARDATLADEEVRRIAAARARGKELMQPDEETLAMPLGQRLVLGVLAVTAIVALILLLAPVG